MIIHEVMHALNRFQPQAINVMTVQLGWIKSCLTNTEVYKLREPPLNELLQLYTVSWTKYHISCYNITFQVLYALISPTLASGDKIAHMAAMSLASLWDMLSKTTNNSLSKFDYKEVVSLTTVAVLLR